MSKPTDNSREPLSQIQSESEVISKIRNLAMAFDLIAGLAAVINDKRQIVYSNAEFIDFLGSAGLEDILGKRTGEIINCIHSGEDETGCGGADACSFCGVLHAILEAQRTKLKTTSEARVTVAKNGETLPLDLFVTVSPLLYESHYFYVVTIKDISSEKRKAALERVFFHDMINSAGALDGIMSILMTTEDPGRIKSLLEITGKHTKVLLDDLLSFRQIAQAESGELAVKKETVSPRRVIDEAAGLMRFHPAARGRNISVDQGCVDVNISTDRSLLLRVLINMLKNAIEASGDSSVITIGAEHFESAVRFWVKNDGVMNEDVKHQIFQRNFSTKDAGRGVGTYSMKLFSEKYLNGKIYFVSQAGTGTVFYVEVPLS